MVVIGLTGSIGSGKSSVARMLAELGAVTLDADTVGHEALTPHTEVWREVVVAFGEDILRQDSSVDRQKLGEIVFRDTTLLAKLNSIMHPRMFQIVQARLEEWRRQGVKVAVLEAPLLIEAGWTPLVDHVWVIVVSEDKAIERMVQGSRFPEAQARARWQSQLPVAEKVRHGEVIDNSGSLDDLRARVGMLWEKIEEQLE
jgi:dephospho-CoA kinase